MLLSVDFVIFIVLPIILICLYCLYKLTEVRQCNAKLESDLAKTKTSLESNLTLANQLAKTKTSLAQVRQDSKQLYSELEKNASTMLI